MKSNTVNFEARATTQWVSGEIKRLRIGGDLSAAIEGVKPLFFNWLKADTVFEKNTVTLAKAMRKAWELYQKQENHGGRVGLVRLLDASIPEGKTARDLFSNPTFNRMNYLIDKVGRKPADSSDRIPVAQKRKRMSKAIATFHKQFARKQITLADVDTLVATLLAEIWPENGVAEVIELAA